MSTSTTARAQLVRHRSPSAVTARKSVAKETTRWARETARWVMVAILAAVLPSSLHARQATGTAGDPLLLPDVVVTATRGLPMELSRVPLAVSVVTGDEIRSLGIRTVSEALERLPGLTVMTTGSAGSQTSVFVRGGESDYVKVLVDGVPVNEAGGAIDFADLSTDQVERIEVVRGPAGVLYGSDAASGVIQIFTRRGRGAPRLDVTVMGGFGERRLGSGTHGLMDAEATASGASGSVSWAVGGGRSWSGGTYPLNNENELNAASAHLGWSDGAGSTLAIAARASAGEFRFPTDGAGNVVDQNQRVERGSVTTSLTAERRFGDRFSVGGLVGIASRDQLQSDEQDGPGDTSGIFASTYDSDVRRTSADVRVTGSFEPIMVTVGGAWEGMTGDVAYESDSEFGPYGASAEFERSNTAMYVEAIGGSEGGVQATVGKRVDWNETYGSFETHRLGASWTAAGGTRVRAAAGRAFREPTFGENFGSGFGDVGNPDLRPERVRSWEVGVDGELGGVRVATTWFDQRFRDLIQFTFATSGAADPNYRNVGAARASGIETSAEVDVGPVALQVTHTFLSTEVLDPGLATDATFVQGERLLRRPEHSGSITARLGGTRGSLAATANVVGERADVDFGAGFPAPRVTLARHTTFDLAAEYVLPALGGAAARILLKADNLFDAEYDGIAGFPAPGRIVRVGASVGIGR